MMNGKNPFDIDVTKAFAGFTLPAIDPESVMASQRKNLEALTQANQLAVEGVQAVTRRQVELAREAFEGASAAFRDLVSPGAPEDRFAKNAALAKEAFEKGVANAKEIAELFSKAHTDAFDVITKRMSESLDEIQAQARSKIR
ncbi:MAG TPA: phasin family protein [Stellaceae bacterium]|nr:phasin family protein [Stellaceae bacterium]